MSTPIENDISIYYLSQFKTPWEWKLMSNDMIDIIFSDYYFTYNMVIKLKKIMYNMMYNINLLKENNMDPSYLYYILFGAYKNLIYLKSKCSEWSNREMNDYKKFLVSLKNNFETIDLKGLNYSSELEIYSRQLIEMIERENIKFNF